MDHISKDRVILIENTKGGWYEKAIFILNKDIPNKQRPKDIVSEAERIIEDYVKRNKLSNNGKIVKLNTSRSYLKRNRINWILNSCLVFSIVLFIYCVAQLFM